MFSCLWLQSGNSIWNCHVFFISQKERLQRLVAPGISMVPHCACGSFDTGLLHIQYVNTCMHTDFLYKYSYKGKMSTRINTYMCKHKHPIHSHTPHAVLCFHVLCPNFWLVPTSKKELLVYFLAASKYFTQSAFMLEIWAMHGRYLVSQDSKQTATLQQGPTLTDPA